MKLYDRTLEKKSLRFITAGRPSSNWLLGSLSDEDFGTPATREAFRRIRKHARVKSEIITWDDLLHDPGLKEDTRKALALYTKVPTVSKDRAKSLQRALEKYRRSRVQFQGLDEVIKDFTKDSIDNDAIDAKLGEIISKSRSKAGETMRTFTTGVKNTSAKLVKELLKGETLTFLPTGFKAFDSINHGITKGSLFVIGGSTGGGKTTLSLRLQSNFADNGAKTCIVSLEMTEHEVMARNLSRYSKISALKLMEPKSLSDKERKRVVDSYKARVTHLKKRGASETIHTPQDDMTLEDILFVLKSYAYDVIIIDYISLLKNSGGEDSWQKLGDIARFAKVFAKNNNCIIVLLAQVSPEGIIRYSRAIEESANNAWYFVRDAKSWESHIIHIMQKKCRAGRMFNFDLFEDFNHMDVYDVPEGYMDQLDKQGGNSKPSQEAPRSRFGKGDRSKPADKEEPAFKNKHTVDEASYFDDEDDDE